MPQTPHETPKTESRQAGRSGDDWNQEVVPRLPAQFEQEAKRLKAFERSRQIGSALVEEESTTVRLAMAEAMQVVASEPTPASAAAGSA